LTRHIRSRGAMKAVISTVDITADILVKKAKSSPGLVGRDLVKEVTTDNIFEFKKEPADLTSITGHRYRHPKDTGLSVVAYDFGIKENILLSLIAMGVRVKVVPASTTADVVLSLKPDGILLSNGPGDPEGVPYAIAEIKKLIGKRPIFGICLGHQLLGLALGAKTYKLKFGHRGGNQPVKNLKTGRVEITAQNHGFAVDAESLDSDLEITHINLNDNTIEGFRHKSAPAFCVQYHPEASPGPHDAHYLFSDFVKLMKEYR
jgi:carbamoyl-phosphate synthase small subunit